MLLGMFSKQVMLVFKRLRSKFCDGQWGALNILGIVYVFKLLIYNVLLISVSDKLIGFYIQTFQTIYCIFQILISF